MIPSSLVSHSMHVKRTEQIWIKSSDILHNFCRVSKNLYNEANYIIRQELFQNKNWIRYPDFYHLVKQSANYKYLPAQTAQQILRQLENNWKSFFTAIKVWKDHPEKFLSCPRPPRYKQKKGEHLLIFSNQQVKIMNQYLLFPKKLNIQVKTRLKDTTKLREVRIIPKGIGYVLEIVYEKEVKQLSLDNHRVAGIDLGVTNLVTMVNNIGLVPIVIKGGVVKSINQYYNKERSRLFSIYDRQGNKTKLGKEILKLSSRRDHKLHDKFHKISRKVIDYCINQKIGTIVIGYNENWKQKAKLGKLNNQNFITIPFQKLVQKIQYKAEEIGIQVILINESYSSKCSFLDHEPIQKFLKYKGKRISRSLFRAHDGTLIHADVNGAYNIIRKALPEAFTNGIEDVGLHPIRWRLSLVTS